MAAATERKAFNKTATLALQLLELDPVNAKARAIVVESHLAHARKLAKSGKYPQAEKEMDAAARLERTGAHNGVIEIHRGLLAFQQNQPDQTRRWLQESLGRAGGNPLLTRLRLAMEAGRFGIAFNAVASNLPAAESVNRAMVLASVNQIQAYREQDTKRLSATLQLMQPVLQNAVDSLNTEQDWLAVCECYYQIPHHGLLEHCATLALKREGEKPLFVYYQIYGRTAGQAFRMADRDYERLEQAAAQAKAQRDERASALIRRFLSSAAGPGLFDLPTAPKDISDLIDSLLDKLAPGQQDELLDRLLNDMDGAGLPDMFPLPFPDLPEPRKPRRKRKKSRKRS
jgi:hypothetical protein